jgi:predicted TPR repeat methyltransferase
MLKQLINKLNIFNISPAPPITTTMLEAAWEHYYKSDYSKAYPIFSQILTLAPDHPGGLHGFGLCAWMTGDLQTAEEYLDQVLRIHHDRPYIYLSLSKLSIRTNQLDKAKQLLQKLLKLSPEHPDAIHTLSALNKQLPAKPPEKYIPNYFKTYKDLFEEHMATLDYETPQILIKLLNTFKSQRDLETPNNYLHNVLDLGCGTGLLGKEIKNIFSKCTLHGVDVTDNMLQQAKDKNIYKHTYLQDMHVYLQETNYNFDLICAADSLVYLGDLSELLKLSYQKLSSHGLLLFSVEHSEEQKPYYLQLNGRYAHSSDYIASLAEKLGFTLLAQNFCSCRKELGEPVIGNHSLYQK